MTADEARSGYIAGLRALADALDASPEIPIPDYGASSWQPLRWVLTVGSADHQKDAVRDIVRTLGGKWDKRVAGAGDALMAFEGKLAGLHVDIITHRESVCRRVVTGTREVTKTVPAPDAPTVEITETVEDVEWICEPLLAGATA